MSRVEELLQSYIEEHREGGDANPVAFLREVSGAERDELAALIDHYLSRAPANAFDREEFERFRADSRRQAIAERILAPTLEEVRDEAALSKREVAEALARDLAVVGHEQAMKARYHELETGQLDPRRIATQVWGALAVMFGQPVDRLREIVDSAYEGGVRGGEAAAVFARRSLPHAPASRGTPAPAGQASPAEDPVDAAFFSHSSADVATDPELDEQYEIFRDFVDSHGPQQAAQNLRRLKIPDEVIERLVERFERSVAEITAHGDDGYMQKGARFTWYTGPRSGDRCWWPLHDGLAGDWTTENLAALDDSTSTILGLLDHPATETFSSRGLVLGHVQSGKTTNFTGVMAKAADRGYRLFIVLSGIHNELRRQTQNRLVEAAGRPTTRSSGSS